MMTMLNQDQPCVTVQQQFDLVAKYVHCKNSVRQFLCPLHRELTPPGPGRLGHGGLHAFTAPRVPHNCVRGPTRGSPRRRGERENPLDVGKQGGWLGPAVSHQPQDNHLLAALPRAAFARLLPQLEPVTWECGAVLSAPDNAMASLYFPTTALVSLVYTMADGATAGMGLIGNDGMVGVPLILGGITTPHWAIVQVAGGAFQLAATVLHAEWQRGGALQRVLLRSIQTLLTQIAQTAVCNQLHPLAKRLCRWLLFIHDRAPTDEVPITHARLAEIVGAYRESVTVVAGHLQAAGLIRSARGSITILDRPGLEAMVCECYRVVQGEYTRLLG